jgi:hypothetical protein
MYDVIYEKLAEKGLTEKWEEENMLDKEGNIVMDEEHMYGRPTKYNLTHPVNMVFVDDVGDNTSHANDGNKTGTKYVTGIVLQAQQKKKFTDCQFTSLGFTATTGEPIVFAVIISADKLKSHEK